MVVSPPTRGWTVALAVPVLAAVGFPAHAGMDPAHRDDMSLPLRFPRPRGDGPGDSVRNSAVRVVSPPTRGWTRPSRQRPARARGFPAHAGMDPSGRAPRARPRGFPRPRGDGPGKAAVQRDNQTVSPPTRGWTSSLTSQNYIEPGFPAHAGMDPPCSHARRSPSRFPRPRGDGPLRDMVARMLRRVSPPTRGWTVPRSRAGGHDHGFPAHAGMDPGDSPLPSRACT